MHPARKIATDRDDAVHLRESELRQREVGLQEHGNRRLDDAARAGWLYYVGGDSQEQIAHKLSVSRQTAQRLVALAVSEGLIKVRLDHPIGRCMELASGLRDLYALETIEVLPGDPSSTAGIAQAAAAEIERWLRSALPVVMAIGTGRTLKAAIEQMSSVDAPQHSVVSLTGNIAPDGSASYYNVIFNMADRVRARMFPMPLPVIASSADERRQLHAQPMIRDTLELAGRANVAFVGIGDLGPDAPLYRDGFLSVAERDALRKAGAVGEIVGWAFDTDGIPLEGLTNARVASAPIPSRQSSSVIALVGGNAKLPALLAALKGGLVNGLITDELTAAALLVARTKGPKHPAGSS